VLLAWVVLPSAATEKCHKAFANEQHLCLTVLEAEVEDRGASMGGSGEALFWGADSTLLLAYSSGRKGA
jgi:hypothetical protein